MYVLVHGGAGKPTGDPDGRQEALERACEYGKAETEPLDAVRAASRELESAPHFNAGRGSAVQSDGVIRTDAGVMTSAGKTGAGKTGAACSMEGVERAVDVAALVATETPHVLLAGAPAVDLADAYDIPVECDLWTERTRERWEEADPPAGDIGEQLTWVNDHFGGTDTIGAVAADGSTVAAATSTGGRWGALAGRVGDVPQIGGGFYASPAGAASATGAGEAIARFGLARRVVELMAAGHGPQAATDRAIYRFGQATGEQAGVIAIQPDGTGGYSYNSPAMSTARTPLEGLIVI